MQRRELFKLVGGGALAGSTALLLGPSCQRAPSPSPPSFVGPLRNHALPDTVEPALSFRPLPQPAK